MSAATNDDCLSSVCIFVQDKCYEELGRIARYTWKKTLDLMPDGGMD